VHTEWHRNLGFVFARAINAMHKELARAWSLDDLAAVAGISRARFAVKSGMR
jgi:AraC-like DNA-binding protein